MSSLSTADTPTPGERRFLLRKSLACAIVSQDLRAMSAMASSAQAWQADAFHQELPRAIRIGSWEIVEMMLSVMQRFDRIALSQSALGMSAEEGQVEIMQRLIDRGEDVNDISIGITPLMGAVQADCPPAIDLLLSHGALLRVPGSPQDPFFHACMMGKRASVLHLLERGAIDGMPPNYWEEALDAMDEWRAPLRQEVLDGICQRLASCIQMQTPPATKPAMLPRL